MGTNEKHIHITVVGDGDTGKTCMLIVYKDKKYEDYYIPTVFDSYSMTIDVDQTRYNVILNDTAGQEDYDKLRPLSYPQTDVFILCFSISNWSSYANITNKWNNEVRHFRPTARVILVGTKMDLRKEISNPVQYKDGLELKNKIKADEYVECSSKFMCNVDTVFNKALEAAIFTGPRPIRKRTCVLL